MKSLRSPIFPGSGLPITPRGILENFGNSPKNPNDVLNVSSRYLSKIEVSEFYKTAELEHFISNGLVTDGVQSSKFEGEFPEILT